MSAPIKPATEEFVILFRNSKNGRIGFVSSDDPDEIAVFTSRAEAEDEQGRVPACLIFPSQIVEIET